MAGDGDLGEDLQALDTAAGALNEDRLDADAADLEGAIDLFDSLEDSALEAVGEDSEATTAIVEAREALERIADGEGTEEDIDVANEGIALFGSGMVEFALERL